MKKQVNKCQPPKWKRSDDEMGYMPENAIVCHFCGTKMTPRLSLMEVEKKGTETEPVTLLFKIAYKCKGCDWLVTFDKASENQYWTKILLKRKNRMLYYPMHLWNEDAFIKRQLKGVGYW